MYAIVDIAGQQFKVEKDQKIFVHRLEGEEGTKVDFDQVLLVDNDGKVQVGTPVVKNTIVKASILSHVKGDKVQVFKKKRRKGYQVSNGHRQSFTELLIEGIGEGTVKAAAAKKEAPKAAPKSEKAEEKPAAAKAETKTTAKAEDKPAEKKPAAKKTTAKKSETAEKKPAAKKTTAAKKPAAKKPAAKAAAKPKKEDTKKSEE